MNQFDLKKQHRLTSQQGKEKTETFDDTGAAKTQDPHNRNAILGKARELLQNGEIEKRRRVCWKFLKTIVETAKPTN